VLAVVATAFKMTLALPFLGLLLLQRRFRTLALGVGVPVLLNALGFLRMGDAAFANYQHDIASLDAIDANINTPDPWLPFALPRLDWVFLVYGFKKNLALARLLTLVSSAGVALLLLREGLRTQSRRTSVERAFGAARLPTVALRLSPPVRRLPVLRARAARGLRQQRGRLDWAVIAILPVVLMMTLLPIGKAASSKRCSGPSGGR
jgi:hypothetical protein